MTDIFLSSGLDIDIDIVKRKLSWTNRTKCWTGRKNSLSWLVSHVGQAQLWAPAFDPQSNTTVLIAGRFAFDEKDWCKAERLPFEGGLAGRLILEYWLKGCDFVPTGMNGGGLAVVIQSNPQFLHVWTDRLGFYPIYEWRGSGFVLCSHPDVSADLLWRSGYQCRLDVTTIAEFLRTGTASQPYTYWKDVNQLDAATHYVYNFADDPGLISEKQYWRPAYFDEVYLNDRREIVERLESAIRNAVYKRTLPRLGKAALMLSAGADSRAALFAANDPSALTCYTLYDERNPELSRSEQLAKAAGAKHVSYKRDGDYYFENAPEAVRVSGGMWSVDSAHFGGFFASMREEFPDVLLTGCYVDYLLKGLGYNRIHRRLFGGNIPLYSIGPLKAQFYQPYFEIATEWQNKVDLRWQSRIDRLSDLIKGNPSKVEYLRVSPIIREADASGRLHLRRTTPIDVFTSDTEIVDLFGLIHPSQKINGIPFGMAVSRIVGQAAKDIPNNNYSTSVGAGESQRVLQFLTASLIRKLHATRENGGNGRASNSIATAGSWPHFPNAISRSEWLRDWQASQPQDQREFLFEILGPERRKWSLDDWASNSSNLFLRYLTASLWLSQHPQALQRLY